MKSAPDIILTFEDPATDFILDLFDKTVNDDGLIANKSDPEDVVYTPAGITIQRNEFAGIRKGSEIFIRSDIDSVLELVDQDG